MDNKSLRDSTFLGWFSNDQPFGTYFQQYLSPLDFCILRMCCSALRNVSFKKTPQYFSCQLVPCFNAAIRARYFRLALWLYELNFDAKLPVPIEVDDDELPYYLITKSSEEQEAQRILIQKILFWEFSSHCYHAATANNIPLMKSLYEKTVNDGSHMLCDMFAQRGDIETLKWLVERNFQPTIHSLIAAVAGGMNNISTIKYIKTLVDWNSQVFVRAAFHNHFDLVQWLHEHGCPVSDGIYTGAAIHGNIEMLEWAQKIILSVTTDRSKEVHYEAITHGHLHVLEWLKKNQMSVLLPGGNRRAVVANQFQVLQYLYHHENQTLMDEFCSIAAQNNNLEMLKWLFERGCKVEPKCILHAAKNGNLDMIQWLRAQSCDWHVEAPLNAIMSGRLDVLYWMLDHGCPPTLVLSGAAFTGNIPLMEWARKRDYPWDLAFLYALKNRHHESIQWLRDHDCPFYISSSPWVLQHCDLWTLQWLKKQSLLDPQDLSMENVANFEMLKWVKETFDIPWNAAFTAKAAFYRRMKILRWLMERGCPWDVNEWNQEISAHANEEETIIRLLFDIGDAEWAEPIRNSLLNK